MNFNIHTGLDILQGQALLRGVKQLLTRAGIGKKKQQKGKKTDRLKSTDMKSLLQLISTCEI